MGPTRCLCATMLSRHIGVLHKFAFSNLKPGYCDPAPAHEQEKVGPWRRGEGIPVRSWLTLGLSYDQHQLHLQ